jgi:hypothetical protein
MLTSNQRGRGNDPVVVLGRMRPSVAVNKGCLQGNSNKDLPAVALAAIEPFSSREQRRERVRLERMARGCDVTNAGPN